MSDQCYQSLRGKLEARTARVGVVGLGYVGLPLAEAFASAGYTVCGFDIDSQKIDALNRGESYIRHIDSERHPFQERAQRSYKFLALRLVVQMLAGKRQIAHAPRRSPIEVAKVPTWWPRHGG